MVEKYSPTIRTEKALNIQGTDYESKLDSLVNKDGIIKMRLNEDVIIQRVSNQLYKSSYSAFRELYNNCCYHGYIDENTYVKISLDTFTRELVIQDFNAKGITEEVFTEILTELGTSSNNDRSKGGKFGLGFNAYPLLSDTIILQTQCTNGDCYAVSGKGGMMFQKAPKPRLEKTGTRLKMTLKPDINYVKLLDKITECALTSGVKTYLELKSDDRVGSYEIGLHTLEQKPYSEILEYLQTNQYETMSHITSSFENDDYEIHLSVGVNKNGSLVNSRDKKIYLINSPIIAEIDQIDSRQKYYASQNTDSYDGDKTDELKTNFESYKKTRIDEISFDSLVMNLKNEDMFEARGDREETTKETEDKIRDIVIDLYNKTLKKIKPCHDLKSWFEHEHKYFISSDEKDVINLLDEKTKTVQALLNTKVFPYSNKIKYEYKLLKNIIEDKEKYFYVEKKDNRVRNLLDENFNNHLVIIHPDKYPFNSSEHTTLFSDTKRILEQFGFVEAKQYLKDNKIKAKRTNIGLVKTKGDLTIHTSKTYNDYWSTGIRTSSMTIKVDSEKFNALVDSDRLIQVGNFAFYRELLKMKDHGIYITIEKKGLKGLVKTINEVENTFNQKKFLTNHGELNFDAILKIDKKIILNGSMNDQQIEDQIVALPYIPKDKLYVISNNENEIFIIAMLLCSKKPSLSYHDILDFKDEGILGYYQNKLKDLQNDLTFSDRFSSDNFTSIFDYEKFLHRLRDFEMQLTDPLIKKLIGKIITYENFDEIEKDALELQERTEKKKLTINRQKEYL